MERSFLPTTGTRRGAGANARQACAEASKIRVVSKNLAMVMGTVQAIYDEKASRVMRTVVGCMFNVMMRGEDRDCGVLSSSKNVSRRIDAFM